MLLAETHSSLLVKVELFANPAQQDVTLNLVPLTDTEFLQRLEVNPKSATFRCLKQLGAKDSVQNWYILYIYIYSYMYI